MFFLWYLYNPDSAIKGLIKVVPERYLIPRIVDSTYVHNETSFFEKLKLIHGEFDVLDSCVSMYNAPALSFRQPSKVVITTKGKINFYVNIDTSIIQINNSSKTFLLDTTGIQLQYFVSDYHIDHHIQGDLVLKDTELNFKLGQCNEYFNNNVKKSKQLIAARESLDKLLNEQLIFLIQKGYRNEKSIR